MPTGGVTRENAGDWIRAGAVAIGVGTALVDQAAVSGRRFDAIPRTRAHFIEAVASARSGAHGEVQRMVKTVCFGEIMLRLSPPGFERLFQSPVLQRHVRRRRSQRGGQPGAVRLRQLVRHRALPAQSRSATPRCKALRAEGVNVEHVAARRRRAGHLLRGDRREPARVDGDLRPRPFGDQRAAAGQRAVARRLRRRGLVPLDRHHAGAEPLGRRVHARSASRRRGARASRVSVDLNYRRSSGPSARRSRRCGR